MPRPLVGICAAIERARFGPWDQDAALVPWGYVRAVQAAGGFALLLPPDRQLAEGPDEIIDRLGALVLAGGTDVHPEIYGAEPHPETRYADTERDRFEIALARRALERDLPLLGVCRGMQLMNVATGGTLEQHLPDTVGHQHHRFVPGTFSEHRVRLAPGSLAARSAGAERITIKSHHHQGLAMLGDGLVPSGWSVEDNEIEAVELPDRGFALGVLWHPEEDVNDRVVGSLVERAVE
jgi:putative glutamine amidotransferase